MGAAWRTFNEFRHRVETDVRSAVPDLPSTHDISRLARSPTALLNHLSNMGAEAGETTATTGADGAATSSAAGRLGDPEPGASDSSERYLPDIDSPPPPAAEPEVLWPVEVAVIDPHLN
jgi:hypothetical protein